MNITSQLDLFHQDNETDVHTRHCCVIHGCKYGDDDCTVANKLRIQEYECEYCDEDNY